MSYVNSPTLSVLFTGLSAWIQSTLGLAQAFVVQELQNLAAMPNGPFACMTHKTQKRLGEMVSTFSPSLGQETYQQDLDFTIQLDLYGPASGDWAAVVIALWRSEMTVNFLAAYGLTPLWADDPIEMSLVDGEEQFEERWIVMLHLNYQPSVTAAQDSMSAAKVAIINVETLPR
jgi:hypothetical protein